jgi:hypothetical protein
MINRAKLEHILEYARQQRHIGLHCKVPPEDMVEIVEAAMLQGAQNIESRPGIQTAPALDSSPDNGKSLSGTQCSACGTVRDARDIVHLPSYRLCSECIATAGDVIAERHDLNVREAFDKRKQEVRQEVEMGARVTKNRFRI